MTHRWRYLGGPTRPFVLVLGVGCAEVGSGAEPEPCESTLGMYQPHYTELSGTCGPYTGFPVHFGDSLATDIQILDDGTRVISGSRIRNCAPELLQWVERDDHVVEDLQGDQLRFDLDYSIHGTIVMRRFDDHEQLACTSEYTARFTKLDADP